MKNSIYKNLSNTVIYNIKILPSNVIVLRSHFIMLSMHGKIKKRPGPFAPPGKIRPSLRMTALSYSLTIFKLKQIETGKRSIKTTYEQAISRYSQMPNPFSESSLASCASRGNKLLDKKIA
jgi:hypothetical protein